MEKARENNNCPYCLSPIEAREEKVRCPICGVAHHAECWRMNGKCSVYGCDGWQAWSGAIADKIAPKISSEIEIDDTTTEGPRRNAHDEPLCIECGAPVKRGQVVCFKCRKWRPRYFENCTASILLFGGVVAIVTLLLKGLC